MPKKNNPGCDCCGDVLIWVKDNQYWDTLTLTQGLQAPASVVVGDADGYYKWKFNDFTQAMEDVGARVDLVTNSNPDNWTGNIKNYKLVLWLNPNRSPGCEYFDTPGCLSDSPPWWFAVNGKKVGGIDTGELPTWTGRIVLAFEIIIGETVIDEGWTPLPGGNAITVVTTPSPTSVQGLNVLFFQRDQLVQIGTRPWPQALILSTAVPSQFRVSTVEIATDEHLMDGVSTLFFHGGYDTVGSGTTLAEVFYKSQNGLFDLDAVLAKEAIATGGSTENGDRFEQSRVVTGDSSIFTDNPGGGGNNDTANRKFWQNLFTKPVFPAPEG